MEMLSIDWHADLKQRLEPGAGAGDRLERRGGGGGAGEADLPTTGHGIVWEGETGLPGVRLGQNSGEHLTPLHAHQVGIRSRGESRV